ncbi:MAG: bifunctional adenosylcobinamide kinase/adenosylcobinamide-phosphate guanylyltransferase [Thermodesulfobacteriota bacterium]|nr:bifunctional adenosylcobinamide kinase/adenosylcobinamide-phosphate guanylyltransferase [Thermodesulfobacteriota bacterium]
MREIIFILGGCRSGKSRHALKLAEDIPCRKKVFIATCLPFDEEMKKRIERHQRERERTWTTIEVPVLLPEAIDKNSQKSDLILVDCLTLWISNLLLENDDQKKLAGHVDRLIKSFENALCPIIMVSNEVGAGIVPETRLGRLFRDVAGFANQKIAACSNAVIWMVAGIPVKIK